MSFLLNERKETNKDESILAIAPKFENRESKKTENIFAGIAKNLFDDQPDLRAGLGPLKYNKAEVDAIASKFSSNKLTDNSATEDGFRKYASQYNILHLATHAYTDPDNSNLSGIIFKVEETDSNLIKNASFEYVDGKLEHDNILHAYEIQNMHLNADLVVLSACETGIGKYQPGEGTMSLARAFKYANCPNIVTSLWKVDDESTKEIMIYFYGNLGKGMGKADALAEAKRSFRKNHPTASPFYWAPFILVGDNQPIHLEKSNNIFFWLGGGVIFIISTLIIAKRRRRIKMAA
jgi:CHAT domain-containing protein